MQTKEVDVKQEEYEAEIERIVGSVEFNTGSWLTREEENANEERLHSAIRGSEFVTDLEKAVQVQRWTSYPFVNVDDLTIRECATRSMNLDVRSKITGQVYSW